MSASEENSAVDKEDHPKTDVRKSYPFGSPFLTENFADVCLLIDIWGLIHTVILVF